MPGGDLTAIAGLQDSHRRALASKLGITTLQALADADQRTVHGAVVNIRPWPSLARVAAWQADARSRLSDTAADRSDWHTAASFAVIFAQRQVAGHWERRLDAEQTEVEPAPESQRWPGWEGTPLWTWMLAQLGLPEDRSGSGANLTSRNGRTAAAGQAAVAKPVRPGQAAIARPVRPGQARLRINRATIIDSVHEVDVINAGETIAVPPVYLRHPVRLRLTVGGGRPGQHLWAAVWFPLQAAPGWSPHDPVSVSAAGQAEFDLSSVPPGNHRVRLLAWGNGTDATLAAVTLPMLNLA